MAIYLITPLSANLELLKRAIETADLDHFVLQNSTGIFVSADMTAVELSHKIGVTTEDRQPGPHGLALIVSVSSYYGRGNSTMWEWLKVKMERGT